MMASEEGIPNEFVVRAQEAAGECGLFGDQRLQHLAAGGDAAIRGFRIQTAQAVAAAANSKKTRAHRAQANNIIGELKILASGEKVIVSNPSNSRPGPVTPFHACMHACMKPYVGVLLLFLAQRLLQCLLRPGRRGPHKRTCNFIPMPTHTHAHARTHNPVRTSAKKLSAATGSAPPSRSSRGSSNAQAYERPSTPVLTKDSTGSARRSHLFSKAQSGFRG